MTSSDIIITINGQRFVVEGTALKQSSYDNHREVLRRLDGIEKGQAVILQRLDTVESELRLLRHDQATLSTFMYWILGAIGLFLAAMALTAIFASIVQAYRKPDPSDDDKVKLTASQFVEAILRAKQK